MPKSNGLPASGLKCRHYGIMNADSMGGNIHIFEWRGSYYSFDIHGQAYPVPMKEGGVIEPFEPPPILRYDIEHCEADHNAHPFHGLRPIDTCDYFIMRGFGHGKPVYFNQVWDELRGEFIEARACILRLEAQDWHKTLSARWWVMKERIAIYRAQSA